MREAITSLSTPKQLRILFADLLFNECFDCPLSGWETFAQNLSLDFFIQHNNNSDIAKSLALNDLQRILTEHGKQLTEYGLPCPQCLQSQECMAELQKWSSQIPFLSTKAAEAYISLNEEQQYIYNQIITAVESNTSLNLFIDGKAGTGKTKIITTLCDALRANGHIILPTATSAFAAQLYNGGRTTHSTFKISVTDNNELISSAIRPNDSRSQLIEAASVICWDEAPMTNKSVLACVEHCCRLSMKNQKPFGGKIVILIGDFRQTCPVVPRGSKADVIDASIKSSPLWTLFRKISLSRLIRNAEDPEFASFVNGVGQGLTPTVDVNIMPHTCNRQTIIDFVFPTSAISQPILCLARSILAPTNVQINQYNDEITRRLPGTPKSYIAMDSLEELDDHEEIIPQTCILDYVAHHSMPGMPPKHLTVKVRMVCRMLRNFSIDRGLVKNARVVVTQAGVHVIGVKLLAQHSSCMQSETILLPRITFKTHLPSGHTLLRKQYPIAAAYAATFNSCQGLTLDRIGIDLTHAVFSHGQLYTALSRIRNRNHGMVLLPNESTCTVNVTYLELLNE